MIKQLKKQSDIKKEMDEYVSEIEKKLISFLIEIGDKCLEDMEDRQEYENRTGNLTASKGYAIALNGEVKYISDFDNSDGGMAGRDIANEQASKTSGLSIVVVSGMKYAVYVEARGYNVITSSKIMAENIVPQLLQQL